MKKLIAIAFVATFAVALVACGGGAKETEETKDSVVAPAPMPADTLPADTTKADSVK